MPKIIIIVGLFESPSDCNVSEKKLGRMKNIENKNVGTKYLKVKSIDLFKPAKISKSSKNGMQSIIKNQTMTQIIIP